MLAQVKVAPGPGALLTWSDDLPQQQKPGCGGPGQRWPGSGPMTWPSFLLMENSSWASSPKELVQPTFFGRAGRGVSNNNNNNNNELRAYTGPPLLIVRSGQPAVQAWAPEYTGM